jgi:taurine dioxygenase
VKTTPHPGAGVEIRDVDVRDCDDTTFERIRELFHLHGLVFLRDQQLSTTDHVAFAERIGDINVNRFFVKHDEHPEIAMVTKEPDQRINVGGFWHTDHSYDLEPALGSILVARELPASGGNTRFLSTYDAFDALPSAMQERLRGMRAVHSAKHAFGTTSSRIRELIDPQYRTENTEAADALGTVSHPVVIRHPLSGREALFVNPSFTIRFDGMSMLRSAPLLLDIYRRVLRGGRIADFRWEPGSVAIWDNRATWHNAKNDYRGQRREMHRITLEGSPLEASRPELCAMAEHRR